MFKNVNWQITPHHKLSETVLGIVTHVMQGSSFKLALSSKLTIVGGGPNKVEPADWNKSNIRNSKCNEVEEPQIMHVAVPNYPC